MKFFIRETGSKEFLCVIEKEDNTSIDTFVHWFANVISDINIENKPDESLTIISSDHKQASTIVNLGNLNMWLENNKEALLE